MRKMNWLIGSVALGLGMAIGIVSYAVATTPSDGSSLLMKFRGGNDAKTVTSSVQPSESSDSTNSLGSGGDNGLSSNDPLSLPQSTDASNAGLEGGSVFPSSASGEGSTELGAASDSTTNDATTTVPTALAQKIISDYKQDLGLFFGAWKSSDMVTFRSKLAKAYAGDLYEKHARQAEEYIVQGVGLDISDIRFETVNVESATTSAATLVAKYRYVAQDYNLGDQTAQGEKNEHTVQVRVNLIQTNSHWLISGESPLS